MILKGPQLRGLVPFTQQLVTSTRALLTWADDPSVPWRCSLFACSLLMGCPGWDLPSGKAVYPADPLVCYFALPLVTSSNLDEAPPPPLMPTTQPDRPSTYSDHPCFGGNILHIFLSCFIPPMRLPRRLPLSTEAQQALELTQQAIQQTLPLAHQELIID